MRIPMGVVAVAALAVLASACGRSGPTGAHAASVIAGDWDFNSHFPGRPELRGSTVQPSDIDCRPAGGASSGRFRCRVVAHLAKGGTARLHVTATFDSDGAVTAWALAPSSG